MTTLMPANWALHSFCVWWKLPLMHLGKLLIDMLVLQLGLPTTPSGQPNLSQMVQGRHSLALMSQGSRYAAPQ